MNLCFIKRKTNECAQHDIWLNGSSSIQLTSFFFYHSVCRTNNVRKSIRGYSIWFCASTNHRTKPKKTNDAVKTKYTVRVWTRGLCAHTLCVFVLLVFPFVGYLAWCVRPLNWKVFNSAELSFLMPMISFIILLWLFLYAPYALSPKDIRFVWYGIVHSRNPLNQCCIHTLAEVLAPAVSEHGIWPVCVCVAVAE